MFIYTKCFFLCFLISTQWNREGSIVMAILLLWNLVRGGPFHTWSWKSSLDWLKFCTPPHLWPPQPQHGDGLKLPIFLLKWLVSETSKAVLLTGLLIRKGGSGVCCVTFESLMSGTAGGSQWVRGEDGNSVIMRLYFFCGHIILLILLKKIFMLPCQYFLLYNSGLQGRRHPLLPLGFSPWV